MTQHSSPARQAEAVRRIRAGEAVSSIASEFGVHPATVRNWRRAFERSEDLLRIAAGRPAEPPAGPVLPPGAGQELTVAPAETAAPGSPDALAAALSAMENGTGTPAPEPGAPEGAPAPAGQAPAEAGEGAPSPHELVSLLEALNGLAVRVACVRFRVVLEPEEKVRLVKFEREERDALELLAPFAAKYAQGAMEYAEPVAALAFLGIWGVGLYDRFQRVGAAAPRDVGATP